MTNKIKELKEEIADLQAKLQTISDEELEQVLGGVGMMPNALLSSNASLTCTLRGLRELAGPTANTFSCTGSHPI